MQNINKKGISDIVATLSLALLSITAVSITSYYILNIIRAPEFAPEFSCIEMQTSSTIDIIKACYNSFSGDIEVTLKRSISGTDIPYLDFTFDSDLEIDSSSWRCVDSCGNCGVLKQGELKTYYFSVDNRSVEKLIIHVGSCRLGDREIEEC